MKRARLLKDWCGSAKGAELDVSPRWLRFAISQGFAEEVQPKTKKEPTKKSTAKEEPTTEED